MTIRVTRTSAKCPLCKAPKCACKGDTATIGPGIVFASGVLNKRAEKEHRMAGGTVYGPSPDAMSEQATTVIVPTDWDAGTHDPFTQGPLADEAAEADPLAVLDNMEEEKTDVAERQGSSAGEQGARRRSGGNRRRREPVDEGSAEGAGSEGADGAGDDADAGSE